MRAIAGPIFPALDIARISAVFALLVVAAGCGARTALVTDGADAESASPDGLGFDAGVADARPPLDAFVDPCAEGPCVAQIAMGGVHACVRGRSGAVFCVGSAVALGMPDVESSIELVGPLPLPPATDICAGTSHSCAIASATIYCWGTNEHGQLGDGTVSDRRRPTPVELPAAFSSVACGRGHTCAITLDGVVWCWGDNEWGQLGSGDRAPSLVPRPARLDARAIAVATGVWHTCAILDGGDVACWGSNVSRECGLDEAIDASLTPRRVPGVVDVVALSATELHSCIATRHGEVACWGSNTQGQVGLPASDLDESPPHFVSLPSLAAGVAAGGTHTCAWSGAGLWCWGSNGYGALGIGTMDYETDGVPHAVVGIEAAALISSHTWQSCAVVAPSRVECWGWNELGQLGNGTTSNAWRPAPMRLPAVLR